MKRIYFFFLSFFIGMSSSSAQVSSNWFIGLEAGAQHISEPYYEDFTYTLLKDARLNTSARVGYAFSPYFSGGFLLGYSHRAQLFYVTSWPYGFFSAPDEESLSTQELQLGLFGRVSLPFGKKQRMGVALEGQSSFLLQRMRWYDHRAEDFVEDALYGRGLRVAILPFAYYRINDHLQIELSFSELLSWEYLSNRAEPRVPNTRPSALLLADFSRLSGRIGLRHDL